MIINITTQVDLSQKISKMGRPDISRIQTLLDKRTKEMDSFIVDGDLFEAVEGHIKKGEKFQAFKLLRDESGWNLSECREFMVQAGII